MEPVLCLQVSQWHMREGRGREEDVKGILNLLRPQWQRADMSVVMLARLGEERFAHFRAKQVLYTVLLSWGDRHAFSVEPTRVIVLKSRSR
jgi:hypothetical protein